MKIFYFMVFCFFIIIPINVMAIKMEGLEGECNMRSAEFKRDVYIEGYSINTVMPENEYGFYVKILKEWFKVVLRSEKEKDIYRDQLSSTARMVNAMSIPVNVCVNRTDGKYLLGIEILFNRVRY